MTRQEPPAEGLPAEGLWEEVVTPALLDRLRASALTPSFADVDGADEAEVIARHLHPHLLRALRAQPDRGARLELTTELLARLEAPDHAPITDSDRVRQLWELRRPRGPGVTPRFPEKVRPVTPLAEPALLTNAKSDPGLAHELAAEIATADHVDVLIAFLRWSGVRNLLEPLKQLRARGGRLRVITTTFLGSTQAKCLDRLVEEAGAQVKLEYDAQRARLHAKAWMFHRDSGYDTAYVGSSNVSHAALTEGTEWNVRLSRITTPTLLEKFAASFESYWRGGGFEDYDPSRVEHRSRLEVALRDAGRGPDRIDTVLSGLEVKAYGYQAAILEALAAERATHDRHRNLVVAATGTGKTVIAALDYRSLCVAGARPSLLFVAHRREILEQARRTYREVLGDPGFGDLYVDGQHPGAWTHVFASVQSLHAYGVDRIPEDAFDVVVIDEFHHAEAPTYRRVLERLHPTELLGLTATPERGDGKDVRDFFDGRTAAELRVWTAIDAHILSPFHYFGVGDGTDLRAVSWSRGRYDDHELDALYTGNAARAGIILRAVRDTLAEPTAMRALGFCVSVAHAQYMARVFTEAGIPAQAISGTTPLRERAEAIAALRSGALACLFAADLFNEGIDIPEVDTILFLRPTDSAALFVQQLGRGLRLSPGKEVLTVLDFVGQQRREFRFDRRFAALTGLSRRRLGEAVEKGFPFLPSGCQIVLDRTAQEVVLENVRGQLRRRWAELVAELRAEPTASLREFLRESELELPDVLMSGKSTGRSWTELRRAAGLLPAPPDDDEARLERRVRSVAHVDDTARWEVYRALCLPDGPAYDELSVGEQTIARMLLFSLWPNGGFESYAAGLAALRRAGGVREELGEIVDIAFDRARSLTQPLEGGLDEVPLRVHARYSREEILTGLGYASLERRPSTFQSGVVHTIVAGRSVDAFLITLRKSEANYSPSTMYRDYPISPELFHWESQSTTSLASPTGQRYVRGTSTVLLFVRREKTGDLGVEPYTFLGPATYVSHTGERPIAITWRLATPMPAELYAATALVS